MLLPSVRPGAALGDTVVRATRRVARPVKLTARVPTSPASVLDYELYRLRMEMDAATYLRDNTWGDELGYDH